MRTLLPFLLLATLLTTACSSPSDSWSDSPDENPLLAPPVRAELDLDASTVLAWKHRHESAADLDGDGEEETLILACAVETGPRGQPLWEDGHQWAAVVREPSGEATLLYADFVPNGFVEAAVEHAGEPSGRRQVMLLERTPQQVRVMSVEYVGPGRARSSSTGYYHLESWLPGAARLPDPP